MSKRRRKPITTYRSRSMAGKSDGSGFSADEGREDSRSNRSGVKNDFQSAKREGTLFQSTEDEGTPFQSTKGEGGSFQSTKGKGTIQREGSEGTSFQRVGRISFQRADQGSVDFRHRDRDSGVIGHDGNRRKVRKSYGMDSFAAAGMQGGFSEASQKTGEEISSEHSDYRLPLEHPEGGQTYPQDKVQDFYRHEESDIRSETGREGQPEEMAAGFSRDIQQKGGGTRHEDERWEHRSFKERGLEVKPAIHLGEKAAALERKGIHTDKGDYNREVRRLNSLIIKMQEIKKERIDRLINGAQKAATTATQTVRNEVLELIHRAAAKKGSMSLPILKSKYFAKISNRQALTNPQMAENFIRRNGIETFTQLSEYQKSHSKTADCVYFAPQLTKRR